MSKNDSIILLDKAQSRDHRDRKITLECRRDAQWPSGPGILN